MFAVALVSALIAPWVRGWSAGQWLSLAAQTGIQLGIFALCVAIHARQRMAMSECLGEIHFRVPVRLEGANEWTPLNAFVLLGFATIVLGVLTAATIMADGHFVGFFFMHGPIAGLSGALGLTQLMHPQKEALIGENGVAVVGRFIRWDRLWPASKTCAGSAPFLIKTDGWAFALFPDHQLQPLLADFLRLWLKPWNQPPQKHL